MFIHCRLKLSHLANSISAITLALGLVIAEPAAQKSLAQEAPVQINGLGATFPAPLYTNEDGWFNTYGNAVPPAFNYSGPINSNVQFRYAAVGSEAAINSFFTQTPPSIGEKSTVPRPIAFGVIDAPLEQLGLEERTVTGDPNSGLPIQVPLVADAIAVTYNPQGLRTPPGGLRFSRATYCGIFTGQITNFSHYRLQLDTTFPSALNLQIKVVRRSDSSGSTYLLSKHLKTVCQGTPYPWNRGVGTISVVGDPPANPDPNTVYWPKNFLSVNGSSEVAKTVAKNPGAIAYIENSVRLTAFLPAAALENEAGYFAAPSPEAIISALKDANDTNPNPKIITLDVSNPADQSAYPIPAVNYLWLYSKYVDTNLVVAIRGFFNDFVTSVTPSSDPQRNADQIAINQGYAPLPRNVKDAVRGVVNTYVSSDGN